jgi:hypothetical protein
MSTMPQPSVPTAQPGLPRLWPMAALLWLLVVAGRMVFVSLFAESVPFWDQWDAEGLRLLKPWVEGRLDPASLLGPHNEHRILLTRLVSLALFQANNGQWDNLVSAYANTAIYALVPLALYLILARGLGGRLQRGVMFAVLLALGWLPYAWENTRIGFQSQFYLMSLLAIATVWLAARARSGTQALGAAVPAILGLFTMASGILAPVAAGAALSLRALGRRLPLLPAGAVLAVLASITLAGYAAIPHIPGHDVFRAGSLGEWLGHMRLNLGWPVRPWPLAWLAVWLPMLLTLARIIRTRSIDRHEVFALAMSAWTLLQIAAISYSRGSLSSRYLDTLAVGLACNIWFSLRLLEQARQLRQPAILIQAAAALLASLLCMAALARDCKAGLASAAEQLALSDQQVRNTRGYVIHGDLAYLQGRGPKQIPYPSADRLAAMLDDPTLRSILPPSVRMPLALATDEVEGSVVARSGLAGTQVQTCTGAEDCLAARGRWRSQPQASAFPYLVVPLKRLGAGDGLEVDLLTHGSILQRLPLQQASASPQRAVFAPVPGQPWAIGLEDTSTTAALQLRAPAEAGRLSRWALGLQDWIRSHWGHRNSLDRQYERYAQPLPFTAGQRVAMPLHPGQRAEFTWTAPRDTSVVGLQVLLGNYADAADGQLLATACAGQACAQATGVLERSRDNAYFPLSLDRAVHLAAGQALHLQFQTRDATHPVAFWIDASAPGAARIQRFGDAGAAALEQRSPPLQLELQE